MASSESQGPWKQLSSEPLLVTPHIEIRRDQVVTHTGQRASFDILCMPRGFVAIVPIRDRNELLMIRQFRQSVRRDSYEIPAGGIDEGETPEQAARRELLEETGWKCDNLTASATFHPLVGRSNARCHVIHAVDPVHVGSPTDANEAQEVFWADHARFAELWQSGRIHAGASVTAILFALALRWLDWDLPGVLLAAGDE